MGVVTAARDHQQWIEMLRAPSMEARLTGGHILGEQLKDPLIAGMIFQKDGLKLIKNVRKFILSKPCAACEYGTNDDVLHRIDQQLIPLVKKGLQQLKRWGTISQAQQEVLRYYGEFHVVKAAVVYSEPTEESDALDTLEPNATVQVTHC